MYDLCSRISKNLTPAPKFGDTATGKRADAGFPDVSTLVSGPMAPAQAASAPTIVIRIPVAAMLMAENTVTGAAIVGGRLGI